MASHKIDKLWGKKNIFLLLVLQTKYHELQRKVDYTGLLVCSCKCVLLQLVAAVGRADPCFCHRDDQSCIFVAGRLLMVVHDPHVFVLLLVFFLFFFCGTCHNVAPLQLEIDNFQRQDKVIDVIVFSICKENKMGKQ